MPTNSKEGDDIVYCNFSFGFAWSSDNRWMEFRQAPFG